MPSIAIGGDVLLFLLSVFNFRMVAPDADVVSMPVSRQRVWIEIRIGDSSHIPGPLYAVSRARFLVRDPHDSSRRKERFGNLQSGEHL